MYQLDETFEAVNLLKLAESGSYFALVSVVGVLFVIVGFVLAFYLDIINLPIVIAVIGFIAIFAGLAAAQDQVHGWVLESLPAGSKVSLREEYAVIGNTYYRLVNFDGHWWLVHNG